MSLQWCVFVFCMVIHNGGEFLAKLFWGQLQIFRVEPPCVISKQEENTVWFSQLSSNSLTLVHSLTFFAFTFVQENLQYSR